MSTCPIAPIFRKGELMLRAYLGYIDEFLTQVTSDQPIIDYAGWSGGGAGGVSSAIPHFKGTLSANYTIGDFGIFVQENMIDVTDLGPPLNNNTSGVYVNPNFGLLHDGCDPHLATTGGMGPRYRAFRKHHQSVGPARSDR